MKGIDFIMVEITELLLSEELTLSGVTVADISISYPSAAGLPGSAAKRINKLYAHWAKTLMRMARKTALAAASAEYSAALEASAVFRPLTLKASFEVTHNDGHILSLHRDFTVRSGNTVRSRTRLGDTWCVSTGWLLGLRSFFPRGERWRAALTKNAAESANELMRAGSHSFYGNYEKLIKRKFSPDNYYITENGIAIFYDQGDISPKSEGIPVFVYRSLLPEIDLQHPSVRLADIEVQPPVLHPSLSHD